VAFTAWGLSAATVVLFVTGSLLAFLGYTMIMPVAGWFVPGLAGMWVAQVVEPESLGLFFFTAGAGLWAVAGLSALRAARRACPDCGRAHGWTPHAEHATRVRALRVGRIAVLVACLSALLYPSIRFPWLFGITPGMGEGFAEELRADPGTLFIGVGLGSAGVVGAVLMLGLVQRWGVRFPFWTVGLVGRRVPVALAVVPATAVAVALVAMGRSIIVQFALGQAGMTSASILHTAVFMSMAVWGAALAVAVAAYAVRRRAECATCERGLPEAENKVWHAHPVWFLDGNPIVGYSKLKHCVRLLFWSGQSFEEDGLANEGRFMAAEARYTSIDEIDKKTLARWLKKAREIQWDYKNIVRRKGRLERLK
jgi:hypothetical protein